MKILLLIGLTFNSSVSSMNTITNACDPKESLGIPEMYAPFSDYANILNEDEETELNNLLKSLQDSVGSQIAILSFFSIGEQDIEDYSENVAHYWNLGRQKYDDGLLIVIVIKDFKIRMEVGDGLDHIVDSRISRNVVENIIMTEFKDGDYYEGLKNASEELIHLIYLHQNSIGKQY